MPKRLLVVGQGEAYGFRAFDIRQGLELLPVALSVHPVKNFYAPNISVSPDQSYCVVCKELSSDNFFLFNRPEDFGEAVDHGTYSNAYPASCSASNEFYVFGGRGSAKLEVRRKSNNLLYGVNDQGLGDVSMVAFSDDGEYLVVCGYYATRIYRTNDWTFADLPKVARVCKGIAFSGDGRKVVLHCTSAPYLLVADLSSCTVEYELNSYLFDASGAKETVTRSPIDPDVFFICVRHQPFVKRFRLSTRLIDDFNHANLNGVQYHEIVADPDPEEDAMYLLQNRTDGNHGIAKLHISSGLAYEDQPKMARNLLAASGAEYSACIITTTPHRIRGAVRDVNNQPVARVVRAYKRDTGVLMAQTVSDAVTGDYTLKVYDAGPYDVQFMTAPGEQLNDLFFSRTEPEPM
ncbi:carboxypeptidase regulatory-like domain-containing protein [Comamonadaceae bacterium OH3737_COT-264]|nr:carboxypeptidase regulatory-like domain-containing protein [Comamonadaceae bacterium OH3737_COT-264]